MTSSAALRSPQTCFRLPHCLGCFAACGFPHPPALRDADYRLAPVIALPLWILLIVVVLVGLWHCVSGRACASVVLLLVVIVLLFLYTKDFDCFALYIVILLYGIWSLLIIYAFGEIFRQWYAKAGARPPLSSTHYGLQRPCSAEEGNRSAAVEKPPQGRHFHLAGVIMLLDVGRAATEEQGNNGKRYARQTSAEPRQTRILCAPNPTGETNGQAPSFDSTSVPMRRTIT